jgi:hypothetical protein
MNTTSEVSLKVKNASPAKQACKHIVQVNTSNKILLGVTQGIGNAILTTPLVKALTNMKMKVDILSEGLIRGAEKIFVGMHNVKVLTEEQIKDRIYLIGLQTMWPYPGLENFVAQVRCAPNIHALWKDGIKAHEVEVNMSLAYSLKYQGDIPDTYCNFYPTETPQDDRNTVGIHVCRSYNHQFHANRQLKDPLELGDKLSKLGYKVFIIGHKGSIGAKEKESFPELNYFIGADLPAVAGFIKEIDLMINEDSGIMHVTSAMDTKQLAIFGPTSDMKNRPWSENAILIKSNIECQPCQYTPRANDCYVNKCMDVGHDFLINKVKFMLPI